MGESKPKQIATLHLIDALHVSVSPVVIMEGSIGDV